jgi:hypothetical protein
MNETGRASSGGAISTRKSATPTPSAVASAVAVMAVSRVP